ncbi:MAG: hypothetical protein LBT23_08305 [Synergistaceae bacterium]|jgi:hypothetical protein|nr:hypothetical protein [Synergistaceae bacterium]
MNTLTKGNGFFWATVILLVLLFLACPLTSSAYAAESGGGKNSEKDVEEDADDPEEARAQNDAQLAAVLMLLEIEYAVEDSLTSDRKKTYEKDYDFDHKTLAAWVGTGMNPYATIAGEAPGYRYQGAAIPELYSEIYKMRREVWQQDASVLMKSNAREASMLRNEVQNWIGRMDEASFNAEGYVQLIQAASQQSNYMNLELLQMRTDVLRQMDIQARAAVEEMQDGADETSAFEQAVDKWKPISPGTGY